VTGVRVAVAAAVLLLAGHGVLRIATRRRPLRAYGPAAGVGLSWFAGIVAVGFVVTLVGVLGGDVTPLPVVAPVLAVLALAGLLPVPARLRPRPDPPDPMPDRRETRPGDVLSAAVGLATAGWIALLSARIPTHSNDEYAIWMLRARALTGLGRLDPAIFADHAVAYQHQEYPLFLPALVTWFDRWAGRPTDAAAHLAIAATVGALLAVAGAVLTRLAGTAAAAVGLLLVLSLPTVLSVQSLQLVADLTVFGFAFCLSLVLALWLAAPATTGPAWAVAAAVLAAGAIGTKAEGLAFAGIALLAALALARGRRLPVLLAGVAAGVVSLPWLAYTRAHHLSSWVANGDTLSAEHVRTVLPWTGTILRGMAERWPGGSGSGLVVLVALVPAVVLAVRAGRTRLVVFVLAVVVLDAAVLLAQYVVTASGPPSDPLAARLLADQLRVTVYRVALVPAALLAVAVPAFAGIALRHRTTPARHAADEGLQPATAP